MYVCLNVFIYRYVLVNTYMFSCVYVSIYDYIFIFVCIYVLTNVGIYLFMYECVYVIFISFKIKIKGIKSQLLTQSFILCCFNFKTDHFLYLCIDYRHLRLSINNVILFWYFYTTLHNFFQPILYPIILSSFSYPSYNCMACN